MEATNLAPQEILAFARAVTGGDGGDVTLLAGQASTRRYHRVAAGGNPPSCVIMEVPQEDRAIQEDVYPFLNVQRFLSGHGYPVPKVLATLLNKGLIALEDLGDETLERAFVSQGSSHAAAAQLYRPCLKLIADLQVIGQHRDPACVAFQRQFDFKLLRWELDHFREWLLEEHLGVRLSPIEAETMNAQFDRIAETLANQPLVLVHRDFQSRNLMVLKDKVSPLRVIDFQDALFGSQAYDLVALLRDSYVALDDEQVSEFVDEFSALVGGSAVEIRQLFHLQTVQRKLKDAGRFVFIDRKRGNPNFLPAIPLSLGYVRDALRALPEHDELFRLLSKYVPEFNP